MSLKKQRRYLKFVLFIIALSLICFVHRNNVKKNNNKEKEEAFESIHLNRKLLSINEKNNDHEVKNVSKGSECVRPDIEQFPKSFFTQEQRKHGAVVFHFLVAIYMFIGLAIVCDEYFVPSLNDICKFFNMKEDVAGATFMAAGSSAPELTTTIISLFIAKVLTKPNRHFNAKI